MSYLSWSSKPAGKECKSHGQNRNNNELEERKRQDTEKLNFKIFKLWISAFIPSNVENYTFYSTCLINSDN